ncbi:sulfurtransferase [Thalassolituus sp. LLYu03]|uniref:sulfurtransferase n=1 Tax=Thalassolituus sp. LLYu03 TaxID=3421656 RepID=UPI003D2BD392
MAALPLLLEPQALAALLPIKADDNLLIVEQAGRENYLKNHIPGSVWLDFKQLQCVGQPAPGKLPALEHLSRVFSELGLTPDTHVICSDDEGGGWAGRLIWVLDCLGHTNYSYVNGGLVAWLADGLATEEGDVTATPSSYQAELVNEDCSLTKEQILARIGQPDFAVWDARSAGEYTGEKVISQRGGHIPGAVNYEWTLGMDKARGLRIKDLSAFRELLSGMGIDDSKEIATHCQTHHRSGFTYLVGKILGLNIKGYAGSWSEWGNDPATPVTTGNQP